MLSKDKGPAWDRIQVDGHGSRSLGLQSHTRAISNAPRGSLPVKYGITSDSDELLTKGGRELFKGIPKPYILNPECVGTGCAFRSASLASQSSRILRTGIGLAVGFVA